jgi:alpha-1,3-rhamnosyl/mannosyltransferase
VITVSESAAEELSTFTAIPRERMRVVPNGVDLEIAGDAQVEATRRELGLDDAPYVFWIGSLEPRKNVGLLVDAFVRWALHTDLPHRLVLAGPAGWLEDEASVLAPARRLGDRVRTLGRVGDPALGALYRGADLFAFPSHHEGFGIPVLEAMAQETPVIAADIPALREIAAGAAVLRSPDDLDAWVAALDNLLHDEAELSRLGEVGRARAQGYSWTRCAEETRAIYLEAVEA